LATKLRVLQISHSYAPEATGVAEVVRRISEGLVRRGHEVHVATGYCPERREDVINGVQVSQFRIAGNWLKGYAAGNGEIERFRELVVHGGWEVQVNHLGLVWCTDLLLDLIPHLPHVKVYTPHGMPGQDVPALAPYYRKMVDVLRSFDAVTCLSQTFDEKPFCDQHGIRHAYVIPNGVDLSEFEAETLDVRRQWGVYNRPWVLNVSNHSPLKRHHLLFELGRRLPAPAIVANLGNPHLAEKWGLGQIGIKGGCYYRCRAQAVLNRRLQLRQRVGRKSIVAAYKQADVFALTSRREASPLVILEAMAAGLPWVSFDVGNVRDHRGGMVVKNFDEMVSWTARLLGDEGLRVELGAAGREQARAHHSWEKIVDQYEQLYCKLFYDKHRGG
jgi:glycosyltransferase involved in cell wall biosynthesis